MVQSTTNGATASTVSKPAFGTKEWAVKNCASGCQMAIRLNRKTSEILKTKDVSSNKLFQKVKKNDGRVIFPSSDIITFPKVRPTKSECQFITVKTLTKTNPNHKTQLR